MAIKFNQFNLPVFMGTNTSAPKSMTEMFSPDLSNVRHICFGGQKPSLHKRTGYAKYNTETTAGATAKIMNLYDYRKKDVTTRYMIAATNDGSANKLWTVPSDGTTVWTDRTNATPYTNSATNFWSFETFNDRCYGANGVDGMQMWDGTAATFVNVVSSVWKAKTAKTYSLYGSVFFTIDDITYSIAGVDTGYTTYVEEYDATADTWKVGQRNSYASSTAYAVCISGKGYVGHGYNGTAMNIVEEYTPSTSVWVAKAAGGTATLDGISMTAMGRFYSAGGVDTSTYTTVTQYYEPISNAWTAKTGMTAAKRGCGGDATNSGVGYWAFGQDATDSKGVYEYNLGGDAWTAKTSSTPTMHSARTISAFGLSYLKGGSSAGTDAAFYSYNPVTDAFTTLTNDTTASYDGILFRANGKLIWAGGRTGAASANNLVFEYNVNPEPPKAMLLKSHRGYLFAARSTSYPSRIWYSTAGDASVWNAFAYLDISPDDGGWITGVYSANNGAFLLVLKNTGVFAIDGSIFDPDPSLGNYSVRKINDKGCISPYSVTSTNDGLILYLGADFKIYSFDGVTSSAISEPVLSTISTSATQVLRYAKAVFFPKYNEYILQYATTGGTVMDKMAVYNVDTQSWFVWTPAVSMSALSVIADQTTTGGLPKDTIQLFTGGNGTGLIYRWDTTAAGVDLFSDDTAAISAYYKTAWFDFGLPAVHKLLRRVFVSNTQGGAGSLLIDVYSNFASTADQDQQSSSMSVTDETGMAHVNSQGRYFQVKFSNNTVDQPFEIQKCTLMWKQKGGGIRP